MRTKRKGRLLIVAVAVSLVALGGCASMTGKESQVATTGVGAAVANVAAYGNPARTGWTLVGGVLGWLFGSK